MFFTATVTKWEGLGRDARLSSSSGTTFLLNGNRVFALETRDTTKSKFLYIDVLRSRKETVSYIEADESVSSIQTAIDVVFDSQFILLPRYANDDITQETSNVYISVESISYAFTYPASTSKTVLVYQEGGAKKSALVNKTLAEILTNSEFNAPSNLAVTQGSDGALFTWTDESRTEDGFQLYANIDGAGYSLLATVAKGVITYEDTTTVPGSSILVKVRAYRGLEYSDFSDAVDAFEFYWPQPISVTVENGAPTNIVLTFESAKTYIASDFTLSGFTISSASWTGSVLTLVLSTAVLVFDGNLTLVYKATKNITVTNNVADDGDTVAWYDSTDLTTITKDGSNNVSKWEDKLGSGMDLVSSGAGMPLYESDGIKFNGSSNYLGTGAKTLNQPVSIFLVFKQITWTNNKGVIDGESIYGGIIQQSTITPMMKAYAGSYSGLQPKLMSENGYQCSLLNKVSIIRLRFNGASSKFVVSGSIADTSDLGTSNMGGIVLGANGDLATNSNIKVIEAIYKDVAFDDAEELAIWQCLKRKNNQRTIIICGDSTTSFANDGTSWHPVRDQMTNGSMVIDLSYPGAYIDDQKTYFETYASSELDGAIIAVGLNDLALTTAQLIGKYQALVDSVRTRIGVSKKIILSTMIPCNRSGDQQWTDLNEAIRGGGATPITGADGYVDTVATALNAGDNTLAAIYDTGDGVHENDAGRLIIATLWDAKLTEIGL